MSAGFTATLEDKRPKSPFWQARIFFAGDGGREKRWSTGVRIGDGAREWKESARAAQRAADEHAERLLAERGEAQSAGAAQQAAGVDPSIKQVAWRLLQQKQADHKRGRWVDSLADIIDHHVEPFFGPDRDVRTIRRADVEAFKAYLKSLGLAPSSINNGLTAIRQILKHACHVDELIEVFPDVKNVIVTKESKGVALIDDEVIAWTEAASVVPAGQQVAASKDKGQRTTAAECAEAQHLVLLVANTGLRRFEALSIRFAWVDWTNALINMPPHVMKGGLTRKPVHCNAVVLDVLRERLALHKNRRDQKDDRVFRDSRRMTRQATRSSEQLGRGKRLRLHDLRHTYGSQLTAAGASTTEVMEALSHRTLQAAGIYQHAYDDRMREVTARVQLGKRPAAEPAAAAEVGSDPASPRDPGRDPGSKGLRGGIRADSTRPKTEPRRPLSSVR